MKYDNIVESLNHPFGIYSFYRINQVSNYINKMPWGVLFFLLLFPLFLNAVNYPSPIGWVNDFANVLPDDTERALNQLITELKEKTGFEIAVVIVDDLQGIDEKQYANELYAKWGIGSKNDEGLLILISKKDRRLWIETGYGSEGIIPDGKAGEIYRYQMLPQLRNDSYKLAVISGTVAFARIISDAKGVKLTGHASSRAYKENRSSRTVSPMAIVVFIILMIVTRGRILKWFIIGSLLGGGRGGSFRGGSGGFGGFGGFGGGSSGGGGAGGGF
ncbi:MAG: TPM domain-containing protein [Candidatus Cloacimonetes bacterium]|nr:TPM domain-containing protein [Candidatus Cloacimonadota bacterium]